MKKTAQQAKEDFEDIKLERLTFDSFTFLQLIADFNNYKYLVNSNGIPSKTESKIVSKTFKIKKWIEELHRDYKVTKMAYLAQLDTQELITLIEIAEIKGNSNF